MRARSFGPSMRRQQPAQVPRYAPPPRMNSFMRATPSGPSEMNSFVLLPPGMMKMSCPASPPARTALESTILRSICGESRTMRYHSTAPIPLGPLSAYTATFNGFSHGVALVSASGDFSAESEKHPATTTAAHIKTSFFTTFCLSQTLWWPLAHGRPVPPPRRTTLSSGASRRGRPS